MPLLDAKIKVFIVREGDSKPEGEPEASHGCFAGGTDVGQQPGPLTLSQWD